MGALATAQTIKITITSPFNDGGNNGGKKKGPCLISNIIEHGQTINHLHKTRDKVFFKNKQVMLIDESHTFPSATLTKVNHGVLKDVPYRMFFSGTQTRGDGALPLLQGIIGKCVCTLGIKEAIEKKYLCPLKFYVFSTVVSLSPSEKRKIERKKDPINKSINLFINILSN